MQDADEIAIDILNWLAGDPKLLDRFLALSGIEAHQLRQAAQEPHFFRGVVEFLMNHEPTLLAYCEARDIEPHIVSDAFHYFTRFERQEF